MGELPLDLKCEMKEGYQECVVSIRKEGTKKVEVQEDAE